MDKMRLLITGALLVIATATWRSHESPALAGEEIVRRAARMPAAKPTQQKQDGKEAVPLAEEKPDLDTAAKLERAAQKTRQAVDALALYDAFLKHPQVTDAEKKAAEARLGFWKDGANKKLVRVATKWVTVGEKENLNQQAKMLVKNGWDLVGIGNDDAAREKLTLASRVYPEAIEADFTLGLLNALVARHAPTAEKHFSVCVQRAPTHVSALNNLALTEVRQKKYSEALGHWRTALQIAPGTNEITHNIGRVLRFSGSSVIRVPKDVEKGLSDLYVKSTALPGVSKSDEDVGWLYMPLFTFDDTFVGPSDLPDEGVLPKGRARDQRPKRIVFASGSGAVIGRGFVITTSQLAADAAGFQIVHPDSLQRLPATLVAVSKKDNLAILQCEKLDAPPLPILDSHPLLGTDTVILGYSRDAQGVNLRAVRGAISSTTDAKKRTYVLDAALKSGGYGGPVLDDTGAIVGLSTDTFLDERAEESLAVPAKYVVEFARPLVKGLVVSDPKNAKSSKWQEVSASGAKSTVLVLAERNPISISMKNFAADRTSRAKSYCYEDNACIRCHGTDLAECPNVGCALGKSARAKARGRAIQECSGAMPHVRRPRKSFLSALCRWHPKMNDCDTVGWVALANS